MLAGLEPGAAPAGISSPGKNFPVETGCFRQFLLGNLQMCRS